MPIYLKDVDVIPKVAKFQSALIVLCRFSPAASLAMRKDTPYIELFHRFLKTESYEKVINKVQTGVDYLVVCLNGRIRSGIRDSSG